MQYSVPQGWPSLYTYMWDAISMENSLTGKESFSSTMSHIHDSEQQKPRIHAFD